MTKVAEKEQRAAIANLARGLDFIQKYGGPVKSISMLLVRSTADDRKEALNRLYERFGRSMFENERPKIDEAPAGND